MSNIYDDDIYVEPDARTATRDECVKRKESSLREDCKLGESAGSEAGSALIGVIAGLLIYLLLR